MDNRRVTTETGKPGKLKWLWKRTGTLKIGKKKSWNFGVSHGILPILPISSTQCVPFSPALISYLDENS